LWNEKGKRRGGCFGVVFLAKLAKLAKALGSFGKRIGDRSMETFTRHIQLL
jgi:hypothetical protein